MVSQASIKRQELCNEPKLENGRGKGERVTAQTMEESTGCQEMPAFAPSLDSGIILAKEFFVG